MVVCDPNLAWHTADAIIAGGPGDACAVGVPGTVPAQERLLAAGMKRRAGRK